MADYREPVRPATEVIDALSAEIEADLDVEAGGIGWWNGHVGWQVSAQLGEYLIASCSGVATSLRHASLAVEEHRKTEYSLNYDRSTRAQALVGRVTGSEEKIAAFTAASPAEERREELQVIWVEQVLVSLAQALDRLAAVVLIVSGVRVNVVATDWAELTKMAKKEPNSGPSQDLRQGAFEDAGTTGRDRQGAILRIAVAWREHGPDDWLPWLMKSRNAAVHRAPRMMIHAMTTHKRRPSGLISPLYAQPDWVDTEAIVRGSRGGFASMFLEPSPQAVFEGLLASVTSLATAVADEARALWIERRSDPGLIVQNGVTWRPLDKASVHQFSGYGEAAPIVLEDIALPPSTERRMRAAKLMDDQIGEWES
ncbi:hypothetical protein [Brachybacterium sp. ACRRE]|uniref:hypothetical protein n=1 Tax=Brachybacterium sp. ACRRE TaxID=2918184 RepID=UPI001EF1F068|nr:hypothetical protein [Brachybacterium sp. ACRRE]MCG7309696.1 hypothetical protein [Brachybacterium sp. ACRRE]